jgi:2-polyprenyl-3-methyl-5-hydroxy-6-metoxy-1,4-benzoquinol methylase
MSYYANLNPDLLSVIPLDAARVLEIGCGEGALARAYRARNPGVRYTGVEVFATAAERARPHLDALVVGDIEDEGVLRAIETASAGAPYDALVLGDVLEHLRDPWRILARLRGLMAPGAVCAVCLPNIGHWSVVVQQLRGQWTYTDTGLLDRTHLRFFTGASAARMLEEAGWTPIDATPRVFPSPAAEAALKAFEPLAGPLSIDPVRMRRDLETFQWVLRAVNGPRPARLHVAAVALPRRAGVNEPRIDHPLVALNSLPDAKAIWGSGTLKIPADFAPGILLLHRQFVCDAGFGAQLERLSAAGWVIVSEIDDDPRHWREFVDSDFVAFRGVHAVVASTERLKALLLQWTPNVEVMPNAILEIPPTPPATPKRGERLRIFFGAVNRAEDWAAIAEAVLPALIALADRIEMVVVHDEQVFRSLPEALTRHFHPTLPYDDYMALLATCDIALLPLRDTPFNRLKSDLKLIQSCAAGAVPIFSPVVYGDAASNLACGMLARSPADWARAITELCTDRALLAGLRARGLAHVRASRMHRHQLGARRRWLGSLLEHRAELERQRKDRLRAIGRDSL